MPASALKIGCASRIVGEKRLKSPQRGGEREIAALVNVVNLGGAVHSGRLAQGAVCVNRISMVLSMWEGSAVGALNLISISMPTSGLLS
jgi:hypothetical protein